MKLFLLISLFSILNNKIKIKNYHLLNDNFIPSNKDIFMNNFSNLGRSIGGIILKYNNMKIKNNIFVCDNELIKLVVIIVENKRYEQHCSGQTIIVIYYLLKIL